MNTASLTRRLEDGCQTALRVGRLRTSRARKATLMRTKAHPGATYGVEACTVNDTR